MRRPYGRPLAVPDAALFYVMGASGAGKDSIIAFARERLAGRRDFAFVRRYITRPSGCTVEDHVALSNEEFERRLREGYFCMHWRSHGHRYGIGREVDDWLARGVNVVMNGSRGYLTEAARRYPALAPVLVRVSAHKRAARLRRRGRETPPQMAARLERGVALDAVRHPRLRVIENEDSLERAARDFIHLLTRS